MSIDFIYPEFEVVRNDDRCIRCRVCERQCANQVHSFDPEGNRMLSDESKCVNCQRCVSLCPTRALKIVKSDCTLRENANWKNDTIREIYKQANSGGVLLSSMGNPNPFPVYWDKMLINASQVTNPSIDPLREPMETRVFLGKKPQKVQRDESGKLKCELPPQLELSMPVMFSAMSYGSISYNAHESLARPPGNSEFFIIPGKAGCMRISTAMEKTPSFRWPPGASVFIKIIWRRVPPSKSRWARAPSRASADICRGLKSWATYPGPG